MAARINTKNSPETIAKMRIAAQKRVASAAGKKQMLDVTAKANEARRGLVESPEVIEKRRLAMVAAYKDPEKREALERGLKKGQQSRSPNGGKAIKGIPKSEAHKEKIRAFRQTQVFPKQDSKPEIAFQKALEEIGLEFIPHGVIAGLPVFHRWDIMIPNSKTVIEIDGCYWHGCSKCFVELNESQEKQKRADVMRTKAARDFGWSVVRIAEHDIMPKIKKGILRLVQG